MTMLAPLLERFFTQRLLHQHRADKYFELWRVADNRPPVRLVAEVREQRVVEREEASLYILHCEWQGEGANGSRGKLLCHPFTPSPYQAHHRSKVSFSTS